MKKWIGFTLSILVFASVSLSVAQGIEVHGHRGARARFPENTLPAFEYAMKLGVDYLEMDMAVTKDGVIVISHDPKISNVICQGKDGAPVGEPEPLIHDLNLAEVQAYDCGTKKNPKFATQTPVPGTHIPTLAQVFEMAEKSEDAHGKTIKFNIETKIFIDHPEYTVDPDTFVKKFLEVVTAHHLEKRVILQSFDMRTLDALRKVNQSIPIVALVEDPKIDMIELAKAHHINVMSPNYQIIKPEVVEKLHAMGLKVVPWTPNEAAWWKKLVDMKVDAIISDDPPSLIAFLKKAK